jgi:hypothetical protein
VISPVSWRLYPGRSVNPESCNINDSGYYCFRKSGQLSVQRYPLRKQRWKAKPSSAFGGAESAGCRRVRDQRRSSPPQFSCCRRTRGTISAPSRTRTETQYPAGIWNRPGSARDANSRSFLLDATHRPECSRNRHIGSRAAQRTLMDVVDPLNVPDSVTYPEFGCIRSSQHSARRKAGSTTMAS